VVVGASVAGLCLAHGLRRNGIRTSVLESDPARGRARPAARLKLDAAGRRALAQCVGHRRFRLVEATCDEPYRIGRAVLDEQLNELPPRGADCGDATVVNRHTLWQILLSGLEDAVFFGTQLRRFDQSADRVVAWCRDGTAWVADVLVGADGIDSTVRGQLAPGARCLDTGLWSVYGRLMLSDQCARWLPPSVLGGSSRIYGPGRKTLVLSVFRPRVPIASAASRYGPPTVITPVDEHLQWSLVAPAEQFGVREPELLAAPPERLHAMVCRMTTDWDPVIRRIVAQSLVASIGAQTIRRLDPIVSWPSGRVTLVGEAIHSTAPPGVGADSGIRDAALLAGTLGDAARRRGCPRAAIAEYETTVRTVIVREMERWSAIIE
jgi:2-polyprenyl-6-methoxyphenol hydroxylase-like FAD-dependent oxidoreductase